MSMMNGEVQAALVGAGADDDKGRAAAKSVARCDGNIAGIEASLLLVKWMAGFTLAFVVAISVQLFG